MHHGHFLKKRGNHTFWGQKPGAKTWKLDFLTYKKWDGSRPLFEDPALLFLVTKQSFGTWQVGLVLLVLGAVIVVSSAGIAIPLSPASGTCSSRPELDVTFNQSLLWRHGWCVTSQESISCNLGSPLPYLANPHVTFYWYCRHTFPRRVILNNKTGRN